MRGRRRWGARVVAILGLAVAAAGVVLVIVEDSTAPSAKELRRSVTDEVDARSYDEPCRRVHDATWSCFVDGTGSSFRIEYRVTMTETRCWRARRIDGRGYGLPRRAEGCVDLVDSLLSVF